MFHKHDWVPIAVQNEEYRHGSETNLLSKCSCGKVKVDRITGKWTFEQLTRKVSDPPNIFVPPKRELGGPTIA